jgi:rubredoxin
LMSKKDNEVSHNHMIRCMHCGHIFIPSHGDYLHINNKDICETICPLCDAHTQFIECISYSYISFPIDKEAYKYYNN